MKTRLNGVILLDKAPDITSQGALNRLKHLMYSPVLNTKKAGHTGTLDPFATGLLPVCFGEATKLLQDTLLANKTYNATLVLGTATDTQDVTGKTTQCALVPDFDQDALDAVALGFVGDYWQTPPMYSALKKDGKRLYKYARAGQCVDIPKRLVRIHALTLRKVDAHTISMHACVSKGTYIRTLGVDVATALGTLGYLGQLRRLRTGMFDIQDAITFESLEQMDAHARLEQVQPVDVLVMHLAPLVLPGALCARLRQGQRLNISALSGALLASMAGMDMQLVRLYDADADNAFLGLGRLEANARLSPHRILNL